MPDPLSPDTVLTSCAVPRFRPDDAQGVARLVQAVYGDSYYPPALYDPQQVVQLNETGKLLSVLAVNKTADVVGHYGLERFQFVPLAEASDAIVAIDYRRHHIMEEMRIVLREEANRAGLIGMVGYPVTNHLFSQKADEHFGAKPCGVAPGLWPKSFHNMPEPLSQRMSFVIYFKYLRPVREVPHVTTHHADILTRIARQWDIKIRHIDPAPADGPSELHVEHEAPVETATIRVHRHGSDTAAEILRIHTDLLNSGVKAIVLELPLAQLPTAEVCRQAEEAGYFFSGLGPAFAQDGDALLLQYLHEDLDLSLIQIENPFARELLMYAGRHM